MVNDDHLLLVDQEGEIVGRATPPEPNLAREEWASYVVLRDVEFEEWFKSAMPSESRLTRPPRPSTFSIGGAVYDLNGAAS